ncbi:CYTH domain-containing protein [Thalassotalea litorea]|uniref:CYTH domain-containing protein n=1 Tax=Thalassotalea litorea TaxID=2020715 RepID=A0A5R9IZC1_9GAMM|nr:CYTH and CHAD domain-containing protein [Thalassotalea litorea]TLU67268.1 CYTH domain-containing protein [Thalassotalea litorea]
MDTEIELKYLICDNLDNTQLIQKFTELLGELDVTTSHKQKFLNNIYFDSQKQVLRGLDIGLRIRKNQHGDAEQTIKTAGKVVAGLHQRPEYNLPVLGNFPTLAQFPNHIWPTGIDIESLESSLVPIFTTDFTRNAWHLKFADGSEVELALDTGVIEANGEREIIKEIEIELLSGDQAHLIRIAKLLFTGFNIRPGQHSKAARGYRLAYSQYTPLPGFDNSVIQLTQSMGVIESFSSGFEQALSLMQRLVAEYLREPRLELIKQIADVLALSRHGLWLYERYLPEQQSQQLRVQFGTILQDLTWVESALQLQELTTKTGNYRKKIEYSQNLLFELKGKLDTFPTDQEMKEYFTSARFNELQLAQLELILSLETSESSQQSLMEFASEWLDDGLKRLQQAISLEQNMEEQQYLQSHGLLIRSLLTGFWFGHLFEGEERSNFRRPWLDMHSGIDELENLCLLRATLQQQNELPKKLMNWLENKVDTLIQALEHCRQVALTIRPYWH